jgi:hypothetical protein
MNKVDYLKLSEQYVSFLVASAGVSITVLTLVLTFGSKSTEVDLRSFLIAALVVSTISCFIGAQMMAETAASFSHLKENPPKAILNNSTPKESPPEVIPDNSIFSRGRSPKDIPSGEHLFLLASTNIFITVILLLFALMLLPPASEKVEPNSIRLISVLVFLFVVVCALFWMFLAVIYRMDVKGGLRASVIVFIIGLLVGGVVSYFPTSKEQLLWATFIPIGFFSAAVLLRFAWLFSDSGKARSPKAYILDICFFIFPITFSYVSLVVAGMKMMYGK